MNAIADRVAAGAAFLDEVAPGWPGRIDLETFDITSPCKCVLGQVFAEAAAEDSGLDDGFDHGELLGAETVPMGFDVNSGDHKSYPLLEAEWVRVITARRETSVVTLHAIAQIARREEPCAVCRAAPGCPCDADCAVHLCRIAAATRDGHITMRDFAAVICDTDAFTGASLVPDEVTT